jgi:single-stranded-DNA-specific exonuclease
MRYFGLMQMQWDIAQANPEIVHAIQEHLQCHIVTAIVLANRGVTSAEEAKNFIAPSLSSLPSPMHLEGMHEAVQRIHRALQNNETILVFGDYDADGVTATVLLTEFLRSLGARVLRHLPHRIEEGYGLKPSHINQLAAARQVGLIITVDCGSSSFEAVDAANRFGIDVIITDHHNIGPKVPEALAVINPKRIHQPRIFHDLAGVGVAFYLAAGLRMYLREQGWWAEGGQPNLKSMCDLVAVGTVADMVPLRGINRALTRTGLDLLVSRPRPGFQALMAACAVHHPHVSAEDISYRLAPRINAAGRMAHAVSAYELLASSGLSRATELADNLNQFNLRRQAVENDILDHIVGRLESRPELLNSNSLVLAGEHWHEGVLGIVAAKLAGRYYRPVIIISTQDGCAKGSARSIPEVDLYAALGVCEPHLTQFGGHRMAAGLSLPTENIGRLKKAFEEAVATITRSENQSDRLNPRIEIDCEINFDDITPKLIEELDHIAPYGSDNPSPIFLSRNVCVQSAAIIGKRHRRMVLTQPHCSDTPLPAIQFNLMPDSPRADFFNRLAFGLQWNHYRGDRRIQLVVKAA